MFVYLSARYIVPFNTHTYLQFSKVFGKEVIRRAATPVHNVLVLTAAAQLAIPVGDTQVGLDKRLAHGPITQHCVEE